MRLYKADVMLPCDEVLEQEISSQLRNRYRLDTVGKEREERDSAHDAHKKSTWAASKSHARYLST